MIHFPHMSLLLPLLLERSVVIDILALADEEGALEEFEDFVDETDSNVSKHVLEKDREGG